jgi:glycosyltransferase involved in cell wall biosynthesis
MQNSFGFTLIVPVHNEEENLKENVEKLMQYANGITDNYEILICENGSVDNTLHIAKKLAKNYANISFISLPFASLGTAIKKGICASKYGKTISFPLDLSVNLSFIDESIKLLEEYDVVTGSKRLSRGLDGRSIIRTVPSHIYHFLVRKFFSLSLSDTTCVKGFRKDAISKLLNRIPGSSNIFETELLIEAEKEGYKIKEIPVVVKEFRRSREGLFKKIGRKLEDLLSIRLDMISLVIGASLFVMGSIIMFYLIFEKVFITQEAGFLDPYSFLVSMLLIISGFQLLIFGLSAALLLQIRKEMVRTFELQEKSK